MSTKKDLKQKILQDPGISKQVLPEYQSFSSPPITQMSQTTRNMGSKHLQHVLTHCLGMEPNSPIKKSLSYEGIESIVHFVQLRDTEINNLEYQSEDSKAIELPKRDKRQLK